MRAQPESEREDLERVEAGLVDEPEEVLTIYARNDSEELSARLRTLTVKEGMALTGFCRRHVPYLRAGRRRPKADAVRAIIGALRARGGR